MTTGILLKSPMFHKLSDIFDFFYSLHYCHIIEINIEIIVLTKYKVNSN